MLLVRCFRTKSSVNLDKAEQKPLVWLDTSDVSLHITTFPHCQPLLILTNPGGGGPSFHGDFLRFRGATFTSVGTTCQKLWRIFNGRLKSGANLTGVSLGMTPVDLFSYDYFHARQHLGHRAALAKPLHETEDSRVRKASDEL